MTTPNARVILPIDATEEMLEEAARAILFADGQTDWPIDEGDQEDFRRMARAALSALALSALGLDVEG